MLLSLLFGVLFPSRLNIKCCLQEGLRGWSSAPLPCLSTEALFTARTTAPDTSSQEPALLEQAKNSNTTFAGQHPLLLTTLGPEKGARRILHSCRHPPSMRGLALSTDKYQLSAPGPASSHTIQQTAQMSELPAQTGYTGMNERRAGCPPDGAGSITFRQQIGLTSFGNCSLLGRQHGIVQTPSPPPAPKCPVYSQGQRSTLGGDGTGAAPLAPAGTRAHYCLGHIPDSRYVVQDKHGGKLGVKTILEAMQILLASVYMHVGL